MTDPTAQLRRTVDRLLPDDSVTVTPLSEIVRRAARPPHRGWPKLLAVGVATAAVVLAGGVGWQVGGVADRNAAQRVVPASTAGTGAELAARCPVDDGRGRLVNALRWPGGRAVLTASDAQFTFCVGDGTGPLRRSSAGGFSPGKASLACGPASCEGGIEQLPGPLGLTTAVLAYGATVPGTTRVRATADDGHQVEVPAQNDTFVLRLERPGSREVRLRRVEMFGASGERLFTWKL